MLSPGGAVEADVLVDGERIAALGRPGRGLARSWAGSADRVLDAAGLYVLLARRSTCTRTWRCRSAGPSRPTLSRPGPGPPPGRHPTIIDFAVQAKGTSLLATLDKWHAKADGQCVVDYGFHMIVSDVNDTTLKEMESCIGAA